MLTEDEIVAELNAITDNMAFDSEDGGDTDADDDTIYTNRSTKKPTIKDNCNSLNSRVWRLSTRSSSK